MNQFYLFTFSEVVYEDADQVTYGTYLKRGKVRRWSLEGTYAIKCYETAVSSMCGKLHAHFMKDHPKCPFI